MRILLAALLIACSAPATAPLPVAAPAPVAVSLPVVEPAPPPTAPTLRLPDGVRPTRYAVELTILPTADTFAGKATIGLKLDAPTTAIWMHAADLTVKSAMIKVNGTEVTARALAPEPKTKDNEEFLAFVVDQPIGPGTVELVVSYDGKVYEKESSGIYRVEDRGEWYVFTQFESTDARRAFPCFDEPAFKVPFGLTLHVKSEHVAVSNAPMISESAQSQGMKTVRFADTKPLPTYLIALGVGPFEIVEGGKAGKNGTQLRIIATKGRSAEAAYATRVTPEILVALEDYFGIPYPYEKLDQIAVPRKGGAMENAGLVTYGLPLILIPTDEETISRKRRFASVAAHELAHHWFGDLVTLAWWNDLWLNESFASWMEKKIVDRIQPTWGYDVSMVQGRSGAMDGDSMATARKIRQPIETRHDIPAAFDGITYGKGSSIIAMFELWIGPDKFQRGLKRYFEKHAHGVATTADFMAAISAEAGTDVSPVFSTFLDQVGVPLVNVELSCAAGAAPKISFTQKRYVPIGSKADAERSWKTPICVKFGGDKVEGRACTLLAEARGELTLPTQTCPRWVLANEGQLGYYRALYRGDMLDKLLASKALTLPERVGLYGDLAALVESGQVPVAKALERVPVLAKDENRHMLSITSGFISFLSKDVVPKELRPNRARFVRKMLGDRARAIGWTSPKGEDDDKRLTRSTLLSWVANVGEDPKLIATAKQLANKWITDRKAIDPDLVGLVLGIAARNGDRALFDRLRAAAKVEKERKDRNQLLGAMGGFRDPEIVKLAMAIALTDEFESRESIGLVWGAFGEDETRELGYQFIKTNYDALLAKLPRNSGAGFISIGSAFCDEAHRDDAVAFFKDKAPEYLNGPRNLERMIERADLCVAKQRAHAAGVAAFLKKW